MPAIKQVNKHNRGFQKGKREKRMENIFEDIMAENFLNVKKEIDIHTEETQRVPNKMNTK